MNKETLAGKWHQLKGNVKEKWGKLTDSDITQIDGKREALLGKLEARYGYAKEKAEKEIQDFERACGCTSEARGEKMQMSGNKNQDRGQMTNRNQERGPMNKNQENMFNDRNPNRDERNNRGQGGRDTTKRK